MSGTLEFAHERAQQVNCKSKCPTNVSVVFDLSNKIAINFKGGMA